MNMNNNILHVMPGIAVINSEKFKFISHIERYTGLRPGLDAYLMRKS